MNTRLHSVFLLLSSVALCQLLPGDLSDLPAYAPSTYTGAIPTTAKVVRSTAWSHPYGNIVANWSFENKDQFWSAGVGDHSRLASSSAASGLYVAKAGTVVGDGLLSDPFLLESGKQYVLSVKIRGFSTSGVSPKLLCTLPSTGAVTVLSAADYQPTSTTSWSVQNWTFSVPSNGDRWTRLVMLSGARPTNDGFLELDDVLLSEKLSGSVESDRGNIVEALSVSDPMGIRYHSATRSGADATYQVSATGYDNFWRAESSYLPVTLQLGQGVYSPLPNVLSLAKASNVSAGATPVSVVRFPDATRPGISERSNTGDAWSIASGRVVRSGSCAWPSLPAVAADLPTSFESPAAQSGEANYTMSWSRDAEGIYAASWSDVRGRLLVSATLLDKTGGTTPDLWTWAFTRYEYYPTGQLKRTLTPLVATVAPVVMSYDMMGRLIATKSPDEGLVRYWYDLSGRLRYRQKASQMPTNTYTYYAYDDFGRMVSEGEVVIATMTQEIADTPKSEDLATSKVERKGWIYDDLSSGWSARSDLPSLSTVEGSQTYGVVNATGRLVAKYHRNPQYTVGNLDASRRLVVELYDYDDRGRVRQVGKYMGAVADESNRRQNVTFTYDSAGRVDRRILDRNMATQGLIPRVPDMTYVYGYDDKGRLSTISDDATPLSNYEYDDQGRLVRVDLGGGTASRIDYSYHVHGQPVEILAHSNHGVVGGDWKVQYDEKLGYEAAADGDVPTTQPTPSYAGRITQIREQYGSDVNVLLPSPSSGTATQPLKTTNYRYDAAGRMIASTVWTGLDAALSRGDVAYADSWTEASVLGGLWSYDANSRLSGTRIGGVSSAATYTYQANGNRLSHVSGTLKPGSTRDLSQAGVLGYDADGNLISDDSKAKWVHYDAEGLPSYIGSNAPGGLGGKYIWPLYDADGQMASALTRISNPGGNGPTEYVHYVRLAGAPQKEIRESYEYTSGALTNTIQVVNMIGQSAVIGRKIDGARYYYLKNHQGSIVKVVDASGSTVAAYDYGPYGDLRPLKEASVHQTQKWTGKEYFETPGLYYFGARWYDPELGLWISPDPAHQFNSPYAYGGDPVNFIDPYGLWEIGLGISIGYTRKGGWSVGVGVGAKDLDLGGFKLNTYAGSSYDDNGWTTSGSVGGLACFGVCLGGDVHGSYNHSSEVWSVGGSGEVGVGTPANRATVGIGGDAYFRGTDYLGATARGYVGIYGGGLSVQEGYEVGFGGMQGRGAYAQAGALGFNVSMSENGGLDYGGSYSASLLKWDSKKGFRYYGQDVVDAYREQANENYDPQRGAFGGVRGLLSNFGKTNYCGSGGMGGVTDGVDAGCYAHDERYKKAGYADGQKSGAVGAFVDVSPEIVAADIALAYNSWGSFGENSNAAAKVGGVFSIISTYKFVGANYDPAYGRNSMIRSY